MAETRLSADQALDPVTGLTRLPHFRREATALARSDCNGRIAGLMTIQVLGAGALRRDLGNATYAQILGAMRLRLAQIYSADMPAIAATEDGRILIALDFREMAERDIVETNMWRLLSDAAYQLENARELRIGVALRAYLAPTVEDLERNLTAIALRRALPAEQPKRRARAEVTQVTRPVHRAELPPTRRAVRHDRLFAAANVLLATKGS